jgi:hypothetical protein
VHYQSYEFKTVLEVEDMGFIVGKSSPEPSLKLHLLRLEMQLLYQDVKICDLVRCDLARWDSGQPFFKSPGSLATITIPGPRAHIRKTNSRPLWTVCVSGKFPGVSRWGEVDGHCRNWHGIKVQGCLVDNGEYRLPVHCSKI